MAKSVGENGPVIVSVNPASFLGSKMVQNAYGISGKDLQIGAYVLCRAALSDEFIDAAGKYYDNDTGRFDNPHPDAMDTEKTKLVIKTIEDIIRMAVYEQHTESGQDCDDFIIRSLLSGNPNKGGHHSNH